MKNAAHKGKILLQEFLQSPSYACRQIRRYLTRRYGTAQIGRLHELTRIAPLILQIETTNSCNASCIFCAKRHMKRDTGVMDMHLFEKIVSDYSAMGGGAVSLTPVIGDPLLDPHLLQRLKQLQSAPEIAQISFTTNGIAFDRYSDDEIRLILDALYCIQVSIGGLDAETYRTMFGVDRFMQLQKTMHRLLALNLTVANPAHISFAFRTNDRKFEHRFRRELNDLRKNGAFISHISGYANYSGHIAGNQELNLVVTAKSDASQTGCIFSTVAMSICWDGKVTACGCADFEGNALLIGDAVKESLVEIWRGSRRSSIINSLRNNNPPEICSNCSAYKEDSVLAYPYFKKVKQHAPLPLEFFQEIWGG